MNIDRHAKAIVAFAVALVVPPLLLFVSGGEMRHILGGAIIGAATATLTAFAVWWVPNRAHGYNVNDIAAALIDAGFDAVAQPQGDAHGRPG